MSRHTRYQGAIVLGHTILLISHRDLASGRSYWLVPGGGIEPGESEEDCVLREMREETGLEVRIERLLLDEKGFPGGFYQQVKTYLCRPVSGEASPGYEPEPEAATEYVIQAVGWYDLRDPLRWGPEIVDDPITHPLLLKIRAELGYGAG